MESNSSTPSYENDAEEHIAGVQHFDLPAVRKERTREVAVPDVTEEIIPVPHLEYIERIREVPRIRHAAKYVQKPEVEVTERIIEIPKPVKEENIVTVPHVQIVDRVVEVPQYIMKEKVVEKPKVLIQERLIPIPKRAIEEKIVEIPDNEYQKILEEKVYQVSPQFDLTLRNDYDEADFVSKDQKVGSGPVDEVIVIPHTQHLYRNIVQPILRHIPKPVEVPLTHYSPVPIEHVVDRNVPIPIELEVTQEFLCPQLIAKYVEIPVAVQVTRCIEKPVPIDAMFNSVIMDAYFTEPERNTNLFSCVKDCKDREKPQSIARMDRDELLSAGLTKAPSLSEVREVDSRKFSFAGINIEKSLTQLLLKLWTKHFLSRYTQAIVLSQAYAAQHSRSTQRYVSK